MKLLFTEKGWEDYLHWQQHNKSALRRINQLLRDVQKEPFAGIGQAIRTIRLLVTLH